MVSRGLISRRIRHETCGALPDIVCGPSVPATGVLSPFDENISATVLGTSELLVPEAGVEPA